MNFDEVFAPVEPQKPAEVPYADLKKKFYISLALIFLGGVVSIFIKPVGMLIALIGFGYKVVAVLQSKNIANSSSLLLNFIVGIVALFIGLVLLALAMEMQVSSVVGGINISVLILYALSVLIFIVFVLFSYRYYQEFADITGIKLFIYAFVLFALGALLVDISSMGALLMLVGVGVEIYAIYSIENIVKSAYIYKLLSKEAKIFKPQVDESLEELHRLNSNSREF